MSVMGIIDLYGEYISAEKDMKISEARTIIRSSKTMMEVAGNSYLYGYMKGNSDGKVMVPIYNIPMMSDEEWNRLAEQNRKERLVI